MALNLSGTSGIVGAGIGTIGPSGANVTGVVTCTSVDSSGVVYADGGVDASSSTVTANQLTLATDIVHSGDTNTKIRFPSADTITAETGGSERIRIKSDGQVLVNQTTGQGSTSKFEVTGTLNNDYPGYSYPIMVSDDAAYNSSAGPGGGVGFSFKQTSGGTYAQAGGIRGIKENTTDGNYASALVFYTRKNGAGTAERLRIDSSGNTNIAGVCTAAAFSPTSGQISNRNLVQNGAFNVAQRGTSSGSSGFKCVDRWRMSAANASAALTQSQTALTSGSPYDEGFRNCFKILNAGQSANNQGYAYMIHTMEAQDIANSGWNYTSASSYVTLSFWIKVNVAQNYLMFLHTNDTVTKEYNMLLSLAANTWTKVTKVIPGHADIVINNDTGNGFQIVLCGYLGDYFTSGSTTESWVTHSGYVSRPDMGSTWWTQSNATLEITGVQLEVGQHATPFEHRTYADDLRICQRFFWKVDDGNYRRVNGYKRHDNNCHFECQSPVPMRVAPSPTLTDGGLFTNFQSTYTATQSSPTIGEWNLATGQGLLQCQSTWSTTHANIPSWESYALEMSAEL